MLPYSRSMEAFFNLFHPQVGGSFSVGLRCSCYYSAPKNEFQYSFDIIAYFVA